MTNFYPFSVFNTLIDPEEEINSLSSSLTPPNLGFMKNYLGAEIMKEVIPPIFWLDGHVEAAPIPGNWHACHLEWASVIHAIRNSKNNPVVIELGCGWGCWMLNSAYIAMKLNKGVASLIGVDGDSSMLGFGNRIFEHNVKNLELQNITYKFINGLVGSGVGEVGFETQDGDISYGLRPSENAKKDNIVPWVELDSITKSSEVSLMHIDVQGYEIDFLQNNLGVINRDIKRLIIGTHSRIIEGAVIKLLASNGWLLLAERPCVFQLPKEKFNLSSMVDYTTIDGLQYWVNSNF